MRAIPRRCELEDMMDDLKYGTRNKRGDWTPNGRIEIAPYWAGHRSCRRSCAGSRNICSVECLPYGHRAAVVVLCRPRCRDDEDDRLGLGAVALRGERRGDLCLLRHLRAASTTSSAKQQTRFKYNAQFPADHPPTCSGSRARTSTISCAVLRHHPAVDRGRSLHAVGVRQWLGDLAELGGPSGLSGRAGASSRR